MKKEELPTELTPSEHEEMIRLKAENEYLKAENEIIKRGDFLQSFAKPKHGTN